MFTTSPATKPDTVRRIDSHGYITPVIRGRWTSDDGREGACELFQVIQGGRYVTVTASIDFGGMGQKATAYPRLRNLPAAVQNLITEATRS